MPYKPTNLMSQMKPLLLLFIIGVLVSCDLVHTDIVISSKKVKSIYDGDTITLKCIRDFKCKNNGLKIRLKGVDTPELKGKCQKEIKLARKAKQFTVDFVRNANIITLSYDQNDKYDRYGRLLAYLSVEGSDLSRSLIDNKLGRKYNGGKRQGWC